MITLEKLTENTLKVHVIGKLETTDFQKMRSQVDELIRTQGNLRLLIDATAFNGWSTTSAAEEHFAFVRDHQKKIERVALIAGHEWQHWLAGMASVFVHPEIKAFDADEVIQAESWLQRKKAA